MQSPPAPNHSLMRPRLRQESCSALLRQLCVDQPPWSELASSTARDPLLTWSILGSLPLDGGLRDRELAELIETRMTRLGADLLRAWVLQASTEASDSAALEQRSAHSLLVAELALHLAMEIGYPEPQEAYLAGLWHELGALLEDGDPSGIEDGNAVRRAEHSVGLAARATPGLPLLDAIRLQVESEECIIDGHTLSRILWVARVLADAEPEQRLSTLSRLIGLPPQALLSLRADVTYLAEDAMRPPARADAGLPMVTTPPGSNGANGGMGHNGSSPVPWVTAAVRGLMQGAFVELSENELRERLLAGCALLTGMPGPQLTLELQTSHFVPLLTTDVASDWLNGLELRADNPTSSLTLAMRRGEPVRYGGTHNGPGRSTIDWQLGRWLGSEGFTAWPWKVGGRKGVALFAAASADEDKRFESHRSTLLGAALSELLRSRRRLAERSAQVEATRTQFVERARRIRHEASSPLTLIQSYLDLIRDRHGEDEKTRGDLAILGSEIERVNHMLRGMAGTSTANDEPAFCQANEVLRDLRTLCADTMFASRGAQLDLRTTAQLPKAQMPRSVLRQILHNLLRNAAEAVPAGGRVSLASSGPVSVDGRLCIEIRVIDNGPGMPGERLRNLFSDGESEKGGEHDGIGLSIVRDLLREHGAAMICRSQPRAGTGMQIFIPVHA